MGKTLFDKVWDAHVVRELDEGRVVYCTSIVIIFTR